MELDAVNLRASDRGTILLFLKKPVAEGFDLWSSRFSRFVYDEAISLQLNLFEGLHEATGRYEIGKEVGTGQLNTLAFHCSLKPDRAVVQEHGVSGNEIRHTRDCHPVIPSTRQARRTRA